MPDTIVRFILVKRLPWFALESLGQMLWGYQLEAEEVVELFPESKSSGDPNRFQKTSGGAFSRSYNNQVAVGGDSGSAARFFYTAKASRKERTMDGKIENKHPTVKPLALMLYLCKLVAPSTRGIILDPFMGSGTTGVACAQLRQRFIGCEIEPESFHVAEQRVDEAYRPTRKRYKRGRKRLVT